MKPEDVHRAVSEIFPPAKSSSPRVIDDHGLFLRMGKEVRAWCERKGWRLPSGSGYPDPLGRTFGDEIALMHSELSEALEAWREWRLTSMLIDGKPEGVASEFADLLIRLLDSCEYAGIDLFAEYRRKMDYNETRAYRHGGKGL